MNTNTLPHLVARSLHGRLRVVPAVVVTGARQTGKSTMVQEFVPGGRRFLSLDDLDVINTARRDPEALVGGTQPVTLDEVQREPDLLHAMKRAIDPRRQPGQRWRGMRMMANTTLHPAAYGILAVLSKRHLRQTPRHSHSRSPHRRASGHARPRR